MKKFLIASEYLSLALGSILLEQLPIAFITVNQPFWQSVLIILALLAVAVFTIYIVKRIGLLNRLEELKIWQTWRMVLIGFVVLAVVGYTGKIVLLLENGLGANTKNQATLEQLGISPLLLIVLTAIAAPIIEKTVMRGPILGRTFNSSYFGVVISSLLFGLLHMPTNTGSWVVYGGIGMVFGVIYYKTQKPEYAIAVHFINNALGVFPTFLL